MLIKKAAEASLFLENWHSRKVIMKRRLPKKYRLPEIDQKIRFYRTLHECDLLHCAKKAGVSTPTIFMVDLVNSNIIMEFVEGKQVKTILDLLSSEERQNHHRPGADVQSHHSRLCAVLRTLLSLHAASRIPAPGPQSGSVGLSEIQETPRSSASRRALAAAHLGASTQAVGALGNRS